MTRASHKSAKSSHYDKESKHYDAFNEKNTKVINEVIEKELKKHKVKKVLDLTCGTGSQVFWLNEKGFEVIGYDINAKMLNIAKEKANHKNLDIKFFKGDMRTTQAGQFDVVITIFNAIGHLTKKDFQKAIRNIHANLKPKGLYIFDIFNLNYLLKDDNITKLTINWQKKSEDCIVREIQYSSINAEGILASYDIYHQQIGNKKPKISNAFQTLQVYSRQQLEGMLEASGFEVIRQCDVDGSRFYEAKTEHILTMARKQ